MFRCLFVLLLSLLSACANEAIELARIHVEVLGGRQRLEALRSFLATARVRIGEQELSVLIYAEKPNRVRTEARAGQQLIIQAYDGANPPWQLRGASKPAKKQPLASATAEAFIADADFFDPLAEWVARGSSLEFAGRVLGYNSIVNRIRVATTGRDLVEVWLDPKSYLITHQLRQRQVPGQGVIVIETHYSEYRPVGGVLMPHRIASYAEGRLLHTTEILQTVANASLPENCFTEP